MEHNMQHMLCIKKFSPHHYDKASKPFSSDTMLTQIAIKTVI